MNMLSISWKYNEYVYYVAFNLK